LLWRLERRGRLRFFTNCKFIWKKINESMTSKTQLIDTAILRQCKANLPAWKWSIFGLPKARSLATMFIVTVCFRSKGTGNKRLSIRELTLNISKWESEKT
jgi:hypothetical protein